MDQDFSNLAQIEHYVAKQLEVLRRNYRSTGDAVTALVAAEAIVSKFDGIPASRGSQQLAKLYTFISDIRLAHATSISDLEAVKDSAEKSLSYLYASPEKSPSSIQSLASASLYLAVALKAKGDIDESFRSIDQARKDLRRYFDADASDEVSLGRQEVLMRQEKSGFVRLIEDVPQYIESAPDEAYASTKRVFEYALNNKMFRLAADIFPVLNETYRISVDKLSPVARISYQKNVGHYYLVAGERDSAMRVLSTAREQAAKLGYKGQERQISRLLDEAGDGDWPSLDTFRF